MESKKVFSEFMFSDLQLGLIENEQFTKNDSKKIRFLLIDRIRVILELNSSIRQN